MWAQPLHGLDLPQVVGLLQAATQHNRTCHFLEVYKNDAYLCTEMAAQGANGCTGALKAIARRSKVMQPENGVSWDVEIHAKQRNGGNTDILYLFMVCFIVLQA